MKRKLLLILIVALAAVGIYKYLMAGTTYHIGSDVTDDYASWTAMQVAVQEEAGDTVSFRRDETFREQVTPPNSGSLLSRIKYTAHGTGADPIIDAATEHQGSSWTPMGTTDTAQPAAFQDTAHDYNGGYADDLYWMTIGRYDGDTSGIVFHGVAVPQGATIATATVTLEAMSSTSGTIYLDIYLW